MDFPNRVALVTGGTGALGSAVALDLLASGARVIVTYRSDSEWQALAQRAAGLGANLEGLRIDLTSAFETSASLEEPLGRHKRLDFLICVAGGFAAGRSYETDDRAWNSMLNLNLRTAVNVLRPVVPLMIAQNFGRIVTVSSGAILNNPGAGIAAYAVSKGAVRQLSEILAQELRDHDIRVHCVMPGTMDTPANRRAMPDADFSKWVKTEKVASVIHRLLAARQDEALPLVVPALD
jgi:NAD(P)-dependent dehydrogenase (short-subunit alcohol dehydrogenase family)